MNIVIIQGRPTEDPQINVSAKGKVFTKFYLAVRKPYKGKDNPEETDFIPVIAFGKLAQTIYNNLAKGALCTVLGTLNQDNYIDRTGNERRSFIVKMSRLTIHEWLRKRRPLAELQADFDEQLIPREITDSLYKQIDIDDEDIPDDLAGRLPGDIEDKVIEDMTEAERNKLIDDIMGKVR